ncbi:transcriptional regulator FilR1 domain-containing protein [Halalkalicoccus tibetensis]|uniref:Helix-turn-helix transcriptional regulator n=1 Tax=Halalkalicoccus tibetensis TaxID=175632 RepID=A0ABD5V4S7_9EURY
MRTRSRDLLELVRRREAVLGCLVDTPRDKRDLTCQLDVSRQTVDRAIRELESAAMVERVEGDYRLTLFGELLYREFASLLDRLECLSSVLDLLAHLPPDTAISADVLVGAEVVPAGHPLPHEPIRRLEELVEGADRLAGYSPVAFPQHVSLFHHQITRTDTEIELFLDTSLIEGLRSGYDEELREALAAPDFTLYRLPEADRPDLGIVLLDDSTVWLGVYGDDGNVRGAAVTGTDAAVAWARDRLADCRAAGQAVPAPSPDG